MPQRLIRTPGQAGQALEVNGRALLSSHEQIASILRSRLGQNHGNLLAVPKLEADGAIAWSTGLAGAVIPAAELPDEERARLQQRAERIVGEIRGLAEQLRAEGPAAQVVAQMLDRAVQTPPGEWLYSVGGKPVLAMWGHGAVGAPAQASAVAVVPAAVAAASAAAVPVAVEAASPVDRGGGPPGAAALAAAPIAPEAARQPWLRWLLGGLLALILLALLSVAITRCSEMRADAGLAAQIAQAELRNRALEQEMVNRRLDVSPSLRCMMDTPPAPAPAASAAQPPAFAASAAEPPVLLPEPPPERSAPPPAEPVPSAPLAASPVAPRKPPPAPAVKPQPPAPPASRPEAPRAQASAPPPRPPQRQAACKPRQAGDEPEVVLIVDASGSMRQPFGAGSTRLDAAKRAAEATIRSLPTDVDVGLVDFGACGQVRRDKFYPSSQRGTLIGEINGLTPKQGTPLADAIGRAGAVASDSAPVAIVIVSDGGDSCGGDPCAMARSLKARKPNLTINVIDLSDTPKDRAALQCIASAGGGRVLSPGDPIDMTRKMKEAAAAANCP